MEIICKILAFVMVLVMIGSCTVITSADGLSESDRNSLLATIQAAEDLCYKEFILPEYPDGLRVDWRAEVYGVHNRYLSYNGGHEVYTESTSLLAQYAVLRGDQVVFEQMYDLWRNGTVNRYHLSPKYRLYQWVLKPDGDKKTSTDGIYSKCTNAAGEEARMLEVLKQASDKFTPSGERDYRDFARDIANGLKGVEDGVGNFEPCGDLASSGYILREGFSWWIAENESEVAFSNKTNNRNTPLAINNLVGYHYTANTPDWVNDPFYQSVVDNTTVIMAEAQNTDPCTGGYGLFKTMYNISTGAYLDENGLNESSTMRCTDMAYRLANYGHLVNNSTAISTGKRYFNFLKSKYESERVIWGRYNYSTGAPFASWEATISTYAVFARLAMEYEDYDLAEAVLRERILPLQVTDPDDDRYYGSFEPWEGKDASAFDNLEAAITLNTWNKTDKGPWKSSYLVNWTTVASIESGDGDIDNIEFDTVEARYVRIYCTERTLPDYGYSLWEFEVYGSGTENLALHKTGSVSSVQNPNYVMRNAFDGNISTRWGSKFKKDPQWIYVDLGENKEINKVILSWEQAYATKYEVQVAPPSLFTQIYLVEGEGWTEQYGGGLDPKSHASNCSCLGNAWGNDGDYAKYLINLSEDADAVLFKIRYSDKFDAKNNASRIRVYFDGELKGGLFTENTFDWDEFQWSDPVYIGYVPAGEHELELISGNGGEWNCVNLDCFKYYTVDVIIPNVISNVTITNITATNATITWQTNVPADSYIHWKGFYNVFDGWTNTSEYIQGITYVPFNSKTKIDKDLEDIKNHNFNAINIYGLKILHPEVENYIFNKCKEMGLKIVFRLESYNKSSFNYSCEDADIILLHYNTSIGYAKKYPESVLCYVINMPLDDPALTIPTKEEQRNYVSYFYNKLKEIDPVHPIFVNFYYGWVDNLPQASVTDIADGISLTLYAMRHSDAPYGDDQTPNFTNSNYKILSKDQYDYYIDKVYEENNLFILNKPLFIDTGFADWFKNPDQRNGVVADKKTKAKAINLLKEYLKNNSKVSGWFYFKLYDEPENATWGLIDEGNISDQTLTMNHRIQLTNLFPNTTYKFEVQSKAAISSGHEFNTKSIPGTNRPPTITITSPSYGNAITGENYTITWTDDDPENDVNISLYYDKNDSGYDGVFIVGGISEDDEVDKFIWNTSILPIGSYFIYAKIEDGKNSPEFDYSSGQIIPSLDQIVAMRTEGTITVDGVLNESDWSNSKAEWLPFASHPEENDNTTAKVKLLWDDEYLYAGFDVTDEHVETSRWEWNDDSVSIIINNGRLLKCRQDIGGTGEGVCERKFTLKGKTTIDNNSDIDIGYYVEMKIPWANTRVIPSPRDIIPMDFLSVDHDNNPDGLWNGIDPKTNFSKISWDGDGSVNTTGKSARIP